MRWPLPPLHSRVDASWTGILWVWASVLWGFAAYNALFAGSWLLGAALTVRALGTLGLGIGLCAAERWAWAPAMCLTAFEAAAAAAIALSGGYILLTLPPGWLSWKVVTLGLTRDLLTRTCTLAAVWTLLSGGVALLYWFNRRSFDVERRRDFTALTQMGLLPAGVLLLLDAYLLKTWWLAIAQ